MARIRSLDLSKEQRDELVYTSRHHPLAYMREKASVLLKVADGTPAYRVAVEGYGLMKRDPDTIYAWMDRYLAEGVEGLVVKRGRGRKPAFSPSAPER